MRRLSIFIIMVLMSSVAFAQSGSIAKFEYQSQVKGLEQAVMRVQDNETREKIEGVMEMIQEKTRERLMKMEQLRFELNDEGEAVAIGKAKAKLFGFIEINREHICKITEDGDAVLLKRPMDMLFKMQEDVCITEA